RAEFGNLAVGAALCGFADPEHRLTNREIANNLRYGGIRIERPPERDVRAVLVGEAGEEKAGLPHGQIVEVFDIMRERPLRLVLNEREHKVDGLADAAAIRRGECP